MQVFEKENIGLFYEENLVDISPVFNTDYKLEYNLSPAGAYVLLNESRLKFQCDIPEAYMQGFSLKFIYYHI